MPPKRFLLVTTLTLLWATSGVPLQAWAEAPDDPNDVDGDGFLSEAAGGPDCDDGDPEVHPGALDLVDGSCGLGGGWEWSIETIDGERDLPAGRGAVLALDAEGHVHLAYAVGDAPVVRYATNAAGAWSIETVDPDSGVMTDGITLAVDPAGEVHVGYVYQREGYDYRYRVRAGGQWELRPLDFGEMLTDRTSFAVDEGGDLVVAWWSRTHDDVRYATRLEGQWGVESVLADGENGTAPCLAIDTRGRVHLSYVARMLSDSTLHYLRRGPAGWDPPLGQNVRGVHDDRGSLDLELDPTGAVQLVGVRCAMDCSADEVVHFVGGVNPQRSPTPARPGAEGSRARADPIGRL